MLLASHIMNYLEIVYCTCNCTCLLCMFMFIVHVHVIIVLFLLPFTNELYMYMYDGHRMNVTFYMRIKTVHEHVLSL